MTSVSSKILIGAVVALILSFAGLLLVSNEMASRTIGPVLAHISEWELHEATQAYERGGSNALRAYILDLQHFVPAGYALTNAAGLDLLTGTDMGEDVRRMGSKAYDTSISHGQVKVGRYPVTANLLQHARQRMIHNIHYPGGPD